MKRNAIVFGTLAATAVTSLLLFAQGPVVNIDPARHPNLAAAQSSIVQAYQDVNAAQGANNDSLGGHAARAKSLLTQADAELRAAATVSNGR